MFSTGAPSGQTRRWLERSPLLSLCDLNRSSVGDGERQERPL